jgi:hypothetical protein
MLTIFDAEDPLSGEDMTEFRHHAQTVIRLWRTRACYSTLVLVLGCASVYPFLAGHSLHVHWDSIGKYLLLLSMGLLVVFVYSCAMWYSAWQALHDVEKEQG